MDLQEQTTSTEVNQDTDKQTVPMALITLPQRAALIEFMAKQPYTDVANGIEFLRSAPVIDVTITTPDDAEVSSEEEVS